MLFGVPGAFTPTCSVRHLPGFIEHAEAIKAKGVDRIICMAVNDEFVMGAWGKDQGVKPEDMIMLADGSATLTRRSGSNSTWAARPRRRCQRFALVAENVKVTHLAVEPPGGFEVSKAESVLATL